MEKSGLGELVKKHSLDSYKILNARWVVIPRSGGSWKSGFVGREFRSLDPGRGGGYTPAATADLEGLINVVGAAKNVAYVIGDEPTAYFHCAEDEKVECTPPQDMFGTKRDVAENVEDMYILRKQLYGGGGSAIGAYGGFVAAELVD